MLNVRALRRKEQSREAISADDLSALVGLAAQQVRFGQPEEALLLIRICQQFRCSDPHVLLISAQALAALEEWDAADKMLDTYLAATRQTAASTYLLSAIIAAARKRVDAAAAALASYVGLIKREAHP